MRIESGLMKRNDKIVSRSLCNALNFILFVCLAQYLVYLV